MDLLIARFLARFPRLTLMFHCLAVTLGGAAIRKAWLSGDMSTQRLSANLDSEPVVFALVFAGALTIEGLLIGLLLIAICPERHLRRLSPRLAEFKNRRRQQFNERLTRLNAEDVERRAFDEPPGFVIPRQRGVQVSGIHALEEAPETRKTGIHKVPIRVERTPPK